MRGHILVTIVATTAIACGTDVHLKPTPDPSFVADPPQVYVPKVKTILTGLPATDAEISAVVADPKALGGLVDQWMATPQYQQKMIVFFELAFQQTQIAPQDYIASYNPDLNLGLVNRGDPAQTIALFENLRESFARTVLEFVAEGRPFTDALSSRQLMMTPAMMEYYALADWLSYNDTGQAQDLFAAANASKQITVSGTGSIPISQSVDPTSANYLHFVNPGVATAHANNPTACTDPLVYSASAFNAHEVLYGDAPSNGTTKCQGAPGSAQNTTMLPTDFTTWKLVTIRQPNTGEAQTPFLDVGALRSATELVLNTPRVGFFSTPSFFVNWPTNKSNQARVTLNQALIVATGTAIDGTDATDPGANPPGLDATHAQSGACLGCHRLLDPTRSILTASFDDFYRPQTNKTLLDTPGLFAFQGVVQPMRTIDDFGHLLASHPLVAPGWTQKLCYYVNSAPCDPSDPEFQRIANDFTTSGASWTTLVKDVVTSPITTNASETQTWKTNGEIVAVSRRDHLCAALNNRLGFVDICQLDPSASYGQKPTTLASIVSGMPADGYGRGSIAPILPNQPTLFYSAAIEQVCLIVAQATIDAKPDPTQPGAKKWSSAQSTAAIADFVTIVMALVPSDPRNAAVTSVLTDHFNQVMQQSGSATDALQSTFVVACMSPSFVGVGM